VAGHYLLVLNQQVTCPCCGTPFPVKVQAAKPEAGRKKARGHQPPPVLTPPPERVITYVYDAKDRLSRVWSDGTPSPAPKPPAPRKRPRRR
jgi:hypothetical protein